MYSDFNNYSMSNNSKSGVSIGVDVICLIVQIVFLVLKWTGAVALGWPIVLIPTWVFLGLLGVCNTYCAIGFISCSN